MKNIVIFGAGGHAKVIVDIIEKQKEYKILGFIDKYSEINDKVLSYKVLGDDDSLEAIIRRFDIFGGIIGISDNALRAKLRDKIIKIDPSFKFVNCIHPKSIIGKDVVLGDGNAIMANATINPSSTIQSHCIINTNASIDHDSFMSNFSSIAPNAAIGGNVSIGNYAAIGIGANIFQNLIIGNNCIIGGGSLVCKNTNKNSVYYGSPCKFVRKHKLGERYLN
jgi:sugar O-acyltransferase (sialic acid O-acetyltransferase NeuD family)